MAPFTRGRLKAGMNAGKRRDAMVCAAESEGLPHAGVDPHGTSAKCLECGGKLKRSVSYNREERNLWCQPCKTIRERDCNAPANIYRVAKVRGKTTPATRRQACNTPKCSPYGILLVADM